MSGLCVSSVPFPVLLAHLGLGSATASVSLSLDLPDLKQVSSPHLPEAILLVLNTVQFLG